MKVLVVILLVYIALSAYLFFAQRSFLYFPPPPSQHGYPEETFQFEAARVQVIVLNEGQQHALLYFGGNAEAVEHNAPEFIQHFPNHTIYLVQYRGYGNSTGKPTEANLYADALAIFDRLQQRHSQIFVIGRSLGSGIATMLASQRDINKLVLITPYDSIQSIAQTLFPFFPISILLQDKYNAQKYAQKINASTLLLIAEQDQTIPLIHSQTLAKAFNSSTAKTILIPNSGHNTISHHRLYYKSINQFIMDKRKANKKIIKK